MQQQSTPTPTAAERREARARERRRERRAAARRTARFQVLAEGTVEVCLLDASGKRRLNARVFEAGQRSGTFRSRRFRVTFGNGQARMRVNGRTVDVPDRAGPIGFSIRPGRRPAELSATARPVCS